MWFDLTDAGRKPAEPNLLCRDDSHMTGQSLVLDHFQQHLRDQLLFERFAANVDQGRRSGVAVREDQVSEIAVFADQNSVFRPRPLDVFQVAGRGTSKSGAQNIMTGVTEGLRDMQTNVNVEQEPQAALACPIAA